MGWKCDDCGDHGPETGALWCPNCGSENVAATDADGLTAADRREQFEMNCEELGVDPAAIFYVDKPTGYGPLPRPSAAANNNFSLHSDLDDTIPF